MVLALSLAVVSALLTFSAPVVFAQADEIANVTRDCERKSTKLWNCRCIVAEFRKLRTADPEQHMLNLLAKVYRSPQCLDRAQIETHYAGKPCQRIARIRKATKKSGIDCACYGRTVADMVMEDTSKAQSLRKMARVEHAAERACSQ